MPYGSTPQYNGATPTQGGEESTGWNPTPTTVTGDATYTAVYVPVYQVRFYSGSSSSSAGTLLQTSNVREGETAVYTGTTPTSSQTGFEFIGWDKALTNIRAATDFYAQFRDTRSAVIQYVEGTMTDYFSDTATTVADNAFNQHANLVTATTSATSIGADAFVSDVSLTTVDLTSTSAVTIGADAFIGCTKLANLVVRSATMSTLSASALSSTAIASNEGAIFVPDLLVDTYKAGTNWGSYVILPLSEYPTTDYSTIRDSWSSIIAATQNGTANKYSVGDTKLLDVGAGGKVYVQVAKVDKTGLTFVTKRMLQSTRSMNSTDTTVGGWANSEMRSWLNTDVFNRLPSELQASIASVTKYSDGYENGAIIHDGVVTQDKLWLLSAQEVFGGTSHETQGEYYSDLFPDINSRKRALPTGNTYRWVLRSAVASTKFALVSQNGGSSDTTATNSCGVVFGFTIGYHPTEQEKWEALKTSISNGTLKQNYSVGDSISLSLGTEGKVDMQIAAFDEDTSHVTFVAKQLLTTAHNMNDTSTTTGGWAQSGLRSYLQNTILPLVPSYVRSAIVPVTKYSSIYANSSFVTDGSTSVDSLWVPSKREVNIDSRYEVQGLIYSDLFPTSQSRVKYGNHTYADPWWLRTSGATGFEVVSGSSSSQNSASNPYYVCIGFCL